MSDISAQVARDLAEELVLAEEQIATLQSELAAAKEENAKLRESAELLAEIDPASGLDEVSSNPLQLREQTEMKPLIDGCVKEALLSYCKGTPAKIPWPHRVLHEAVRRIEDLESDLAAAREEIARARKALIKQWELVFARSFSQDPIGRAEARYAREIAQEQG